MLAPLSSKEVRTQLQQLNSKEMLVSRASSKTMEGRLLRRPPRMEVAKAPSLLVAPEKTVSPTQLLGSRTSSNRVVRGRECYAIARLTWGIPNTFIRYRRHRQWPTALHTKINGQMADIKISIIWCKTPVWHWAACLVRFPKVPSASMWLHRRITKLQGHRGLISTITRAQQELIITRFLALWEPLRWLVEAVRLIIIIVKEIANFKYRV